MTDRKWMIYTKRADFYKLAARFLVSPLTVRIMINRDIHPEKMETYLHPEASDLISPFELTDMDEAVFMLKKKIDEHKKIRVVGDYDIDGICATYILVRALLNLNADVDYDIPDRIKDGYGINESLVKKASEDKTDTILTCDNGIAALEELKLANDLGMTVIVTDHHELPVDGEGKQILPEAFATVNPRRDKGKFEENICGAAVAYKLVQALYEHAGMKNREYEEFLCFAAIATVGDVMPLTGENRNLVKLGLDAAGNTKNTGLLELMNECGLDRTKLNTYQVGFVLGPCLNAGGRLESAKLGLKMLLSKDRTQALELAKHLKELNDLRKEMTEQGQIEAGKQIEKSFKDDKVLVIYLKDTHESIAGIIAGRIRERYLRPCIILTATAEGLAKGSGRSIEAYNMYEKLCDVSDLLIKFGGHPMAAGLTMQAENIEKFRKRLCENSGLCDEDFTEKIWIDAAVPFSYLTEELTEELKKLEPFGQGNEKPVFAQKGVAIENVRILGKNRNVLKLRLRDVQGTGIDGMVFSDPEAFLAAGADSNICDILYYPQINEYMGKRSMQIVLTGWKFNSQDCLDRQDR